MSLMDHREAIAADMSSYALLASDALTILRRMELLEEGAEGVREVRPDDRAVLDHLREVLLASAAGAELTGRVSHNTELALAAQSGRHSLDDQLESYSIVDQLLGDNDFAEFIRKAAQALEMLATTTGNWADLGDETEFVRADLMSFLERLTHSAEILVPGGYQVAGQESTLV